MKKAIQKFINLTFVILAMFYFLYNPTHIYASSTEVKDITSSIVLSTQDYYGPTDIPKIVLQDNSNFFQKFVRIFSKETTLSISNPKGEVIKKQNIEDEQNLITLKESDFTPGKYSISLNNKNVLGFYWGVLAINTDKDSYSVGEATYVQMASLSETGHTLCDSSLELKINDQVVPIQNSETCGANNVTDTPDYFASHNFTSAGTYHLRLTNLRNNYSIGKVITVIKEPALTIQRVGATRINPFKSDYTMTLKITANESGSRLIQEQLPPGFEALTPITWQVNLTADKPTTLTYTYRAPKISPAIFELGPLIVGDYQELRSWSLASDATFQMQTGYYVGDGADNRAITGVGFQPQLLLIKDDTGSGADGVIWKSSSMGGETSSKLGDNEADLASDAIQSFDSNGFTLGTDDDVNAANVRYTWVAYAGSDCTSSGTFCVGTYTGDGTTPRALTVTGFQPNLVVVKHASGTDGGAFRTSDMGTNASNSFMAINEANVGTEAIRSLDATGFTVGNNTRVNTNTNTYWYFAFKNTANAFAVGTYTGDGLDDRAITGVGFRPSLVWVKNSDATVANQSRGNLTESNGDYAFGFSDIASTVNVIQSLDSDGFTVGTDAAANESGKTIYWVAFAGAPSYSTSGTFKMATGSYSGNGTGQSVSSLGFTPDLVIIKHNDQATDQYAVFRTSLTRGDRTHVFANATNAIALAITSLDANGFTVGSHATVNTSGDTYYWSAFGNAWNPETGTGAADFSVGAFTGNGIDSHEILRLPFQPNLIAYKRDSASSGGFRTSEMTGDTTGFFVAAAEGADLIQSIGASSFQVGSAVQINTNTNLYHFFTFKTGNAFSVGTYTGNGTSQNITAPGFQPNLIWVKKATGGTARGGILRTSDLTGDAAQPFLNNPTATTHITGILSTGFSVGAGNLANENTYNYRYATWMINVAPNTPSLDSPSDTATNQSVTPALKTTTTDTSNDYLRYKIQLCENVGMTTNCQTFDQTASQTGWSGQNAQSNTAYTSGTQSTYTIQTPLSAATTYYWRSYAIDPGGSNIWSSTQGTPYSFTTTTAPSAPTVPYTEGTTNPAGIVDLTPEFSAIHNDSDSDAANYYEIEVNTNNSFTGTVMWDSGQTSMTSTANGARSPNISYAGTVLSFNGSTYYWRIRFVDVNGAVGVWSATQNFTIDQLPNTPSLDFPTNGTVDVPLFAILKTTATDNSGDYLRYKIQICTNTLMTLNCQTFDQTSSQTGWSGQNTQTNTAYTSGTQATYTIQSSLLSDTTYYWRSYTIDPGGTNTWGAAQTTPYSFTTIVVPPPSPPTVLQTNGAANPTNVLTSTLPYFSAIHNDSNNDSASYYQIKVSNQPDINGNILWDTGQTSIASLPSGSRSSNITYAGSTLSLNGQTYYWSIRFWNSSSNPGQWSTPASFSLFNLLPPASCMAVKDNTNTQITIRWLDQTSSEDGYYIEKSTDGASFVNLTTKAVNSTSHVDTSVPSGHSYRYRVRSKLNSDYSDWCTTATLNFTGNFMLNGLKLNGLQLY